MGLSGDANDPHPMDRRRLRAAAVARPSFALAQAPGPQPFPMSFFVTSVGIGKGGDLGGLAGADAHCQTLAAAVGAGGKSGTRI